MNALTPRPVAYKDAGVLGTAFVILFALPFAGGGTFAVFQGIRFLAQGKLRDGLYFSLFGVIFSAVGYGLMIGAVRAWRHQKRENAIKAAHPEEPWLWRTDWAEGRIISSPKTAMWAAWVIALFWNAVSSGIFFVLADPKKHHKPGEYIALIFPLIGLGLLAWAIRETLEWKKFGVSTLKLLSTPVAIGTQLDGAIETAVKIKPQDGFHLKLTCINAVRIRTGKSTTVTENILWQNARTMIRELLDDDPRRSGIPVSFHIPADTMETDNRDPNNRILWRLEVQATVPGISYEAKFEVPVFRTAASVAASASASATDSAAAYEAPPEPYKLPAHSRIQIKTLPDGETEFHFPAGRNLAAAGSLTVFFLIWTAFVVFLWCIVHDLFFAIVFTLVDVLVAAAWSNLMFRSSRVKAGASGVTLKNRWLLFGSTRTVAARDIDDFKPKPGMRSGQTQFFTLQLCLNDGRCLTLARYIPDTEEADWLCGELSKAIGRRG